MFEIHKLTGRELANWRNNYMKLTQEEFGRRIGMSGRYVRDQEKSDFVSLIAARACRDLITETKIRSTVRILGEAARTLKEAFVSNHPDKPNIGTIRTVFPSISKRERDVMIQLSRGYSNKIIGHNLDMKEPTVKAHVQHIMAKLKAPNRTTIALWADRVLREVEGEI